MTSIVSKRDDYSERVSTHEDMENAQVNSKSMDRTTNNKKAKGQKQTRDSRDKDVSLDRTASEGASGKAKVPSLTYKRAQNQENRVSNKRTSDMYRSASYSVVGGVQKDKETKRLPAIPGRASHAENKHGYDNVKGADGEKPHKYANVDLSEDASTTTGIMEPKYDEVDESTKKGRKTDKAVQKGKPKGAKADHEHFYHTLEESQIVEGEDGNNDEEYSSPRRKALVVTKVTVRSKTGKGQVLSTEESATVKGTKTERAKSYSEKKSSKKGGKKNDHDYEEPSHNTLPHKSKNNKEDSMQKGNLASMFDDPMYIASMNTPGGASTSKTTPTTPQPPPRESSPKRASIEMPQAATPVTLRKTEQAKQPKDDPKYDEPNEKKQGALIKKEIYSSKLFDDPKYEGGFPLD